MSLSPKTAGDIALRELSSLIDSLKTMNAKFCSTGELAKEFA
jgi:hypothetical protein